MAPMSDTTEHPDGCRYEIELRGHLGRRALRPVIDDFDIDTNDDGNTVLVGDVGDASHLNGLLAHFTSMNVDVLALNQIPQTTTHLNTNIRK